MVSGPLVGDELRGRLVTAAREPVTAFRLIRTVAVLTHALQLAGVTPVLVGGGAVEFYTASEYQTEDIDLLVPSSPAVIEVMRQLGFVRHGKDFHHPELDIYVEFPGSALLPPELAISISIDGVEVRVVSPEDLMLDRLRALVHWRSLRDGLNVLSLLRSGIRLDVDRISDLALRDGLDRQWHAVLALSKDLRSAPHTEELETALRRIVDERAP